MNDTKDPKPAEWKNYEDFAAGIATNRLPSTDALVGRAFKIMLKDGRALGFACTDKHALTWAEGDPGKTDWYEAIHVAPDVYFLDTTPAARTNEALTFIINVNTRRVLSVRSMVREQGAYHGEPRVAQEFLSGTLGDAMVPPTGPEPAPTRDLIGLRGFYTYSPVHVYEHIYLSSERYAWQCLVGVQRGHGDVDLATTFRFDEGQYVFAFREFIIPVASVFFYDFVDMRSTGKFIGVTASGAIENNPAGAFIQKASMTFYPKNAEPV
jgi:hypothetical protein